MAHGFDCKRCGYQEAAHDFPGDYPGVCAAYVSPDPVGEALTWSIVRGEEQERLAARRRASGIQDDL